MLYLLYVRYNETHVIQKKVPLLTALSIEHYPKSIQVSFFFFYKCKMSIVVSPG
uniref:Uncharacterized protein n=1 Tax=Anguilla anguilla TaxID=7936 RepID=A0A0E9XTU5_ANGAN